jgi:subtilisin family serine protease
MALTALAGVLSYVFLSKKDPQNSVAQSQAVEDQASSSSSTEVVNPDPSEPIPVPNSPPLLAASPRSDQPPKLKSEPPSRSPDWKLLDWSLKPLPEKPGVQLRASSFLASGKYPFVRVEQEIQILPNGEAKVLKTAEMVGDQIIVKLPEGSPAEEIQSLAAKLGGQAAAKPFAPDTWLIALPRKLEAVPEALAGSTNSGVSIDYAEPNHLVRPMRTPNDPRFTNFNQWHLYNNSQIDKDIKAPKAWDRRTSAAYGTTNKVIVAVIDTGVRHTHEDLRPNMWTNPGEIAGDGIDNDFNGLVDDLYGADYVNNDGDPMDGGSHGTHCAGLIAAVGNNGLGITGVAWTGAQLMALRFIESTGSATDAIRCIDYAIAKGARVINASYGGPSFNSSESLAIQRASNAGMIFVAAVGNGGDDNIGDNTDTTPFYPAGYGRSNIIAVGATDRNDAKAGFSNFGTSSVDLMAPGVEMWSTTTGSDSSYSSGQGTSFAAPVVTGAVALLIAEYPGDSISSLRSKILAGVDVISGLSTQCATSGRLNLAKLLPAADVNTLSPALVWHRPDHLEGLIPSAMRTPSTITLSNDVTIYSGLRKFNNTNGLVNQTGGWLFYRTSPAVAWTSNALAWHTNNGDYQFWKSTIPAVPARTFQYYLQLDFDSGARTTYSYFTNNAEGFATTTNQATAQSSPYTFTVPKATAAVTISGTSQTYNGSARSVSISTTPSGLSNTVTYNGSSSAPTNAGSYTVVATVNDSNYEGSASGTLNVAKASSAILTSPTASTMTFGQTLASSTLTGGSASVAGTFTFTSIGTAPPLGTSSQSVTFTPSDSANYLSATTSALVTVGGVENPAGDADGDGLANLLEHALVEASTGTVTPPLLGQITTQSTGGSGSPEMVLSLNVVVRTNDTNLLIYPEATLDLGSSTNWTTSGFTTNTSNQTNVPTGFQRREYQFNAGTNSRAFLKLTVEQK